MTSAMTKKESTALAISLRESESESQCLTLIGTYLKNSKRMKSVADNTGADVKHLYRAFAPTGNPNLKLYVDVLKELRIRLLVHERIEYPMADGTRTECWRRAWVLSEYGSLVALQEYVYLAGKNPKSLSASQWKRICLGTSVPRLKTFCLLLQEYNLRLGYYEKHYAKEKKKMARVIQKNKDKEAAQKQKLALMNSETLSIDPKWVRQLNSPGCCPACGHSAPLHRFWK